MAAPTFIQSIVKNIVDGFSRDTTLADSKTMMRDAKTAVNAFYERELGAEKHGSLAKAAGADAPAAFLFGWQMPQLMTMVTARRFCAQLESSEPSATGRSLP